MSCEPQALCMACTPKVTCSAWVGRVCLWLHASIWASRNMLS
uniref:Uncharacterized protein n=1 Tax=Anguilla anguilla TaxID=7936 RepID=A0A0E9VLJ3_ANGAN